MSKRIQKKNTKLFFDSLKHFKNNLTNLIFFEMKTLFEANSVHDYLQLKPVNYKSKFADMKKFGLINYNKPADNQFEFTEIGLEIYKVIKEIGIDYKDDTESRLPSISTEDFFGLLSDVEKQKIIENIDKLILSYYDTADFLRPYLLLLNILEKEKINILSDEILYNILAQKKQDILLGKIREGAYDIVDDTIKEEITRPKSYIINVLETAGIINSRREIICNFDTINKLKEEQIVEYMRQVETDTPSVRPNKEQEQFRNEVLKAYNYKCAITNKSIKVHTLDGGISYLIEAAHIVPYSEGGSFSVTNGIALSYEMHKMFDRKLFTFVYNDNDELIVKTSKNKRIVDDEILVHLDNQKVNLPTNFDKQPDIDALEYRMEKHLIP